MIVEKPLRIGAEVRELLMTSEHVRGMVGDRIYPYTTQVEVREAHIVYDGIGVQFFDVKDGEVPESVTMTINCNTSDYAVGIDLAEAVVDVFAEHRDISVTYASCEYDGGALMFTHAITINIDIE